MRLFGAAVAAVLVAGSVLSGVPAFAQPVAADVPSDTTISAGSGVVGEPSPDALPEYQLTPPTPSGAPTSAPKAAPDAVPSDAKTATASGVVTYGTSAPGVAAGGAIITALRLDADTYETLQETDITALQDGSFSFTGLVPGSYVFSFYYDGDPAGDTAMWWKGTATSPQGSGPIVLAAGTSTTVDQRLVPTATVVGTALTGNRAVPLSPSVLTIRLGVYTGTKNGSGDDIYYFKYRGVLQVDGSYEIDFVIPSPTFVVFGVYDGSDPYFDQSPGDVFTVTANQTSLQNVIITRKVQHVSGVNTAINTVLNALYWDFLDRQPGASEVAYWNDRFNSGASLGDVSAGFVTSDEYRLIRIDAAYSTILGRTPDAKGRADWLKWMQQGRITTDDIETSLYASDEYYLQHGNTDNGFMAAIYTTLLHRPGQQSEYDYWNRLIAQHGRAWVVAQFWSSAETIRERVSLMYAKYLGRVPDAAGLDHWVALALQLGDSGLRGGLTGNQEYFNRAYVLRFGEV